MRGGTCGFIGGFLGWIDLSDRDFISRASSENRLYRTSRLLLVVLAAAGLIRLLVEPRLF